MHHLPIKYRPFIFYIVFGILTTIINIVVYVLCYEHIQLSNVVSTGFAWILTIIVVFITNKLWVFGSKCLTPRLVLLEFYKFLLCRISTGVLDVAIMYVGVDMLNLSSTLLKFTANVIVVLLNYIASKLIIFNK